MAADPEGSDVCAAITALYSLKRLSPAFTFALINVNDAKKQDVYRWGSITLAGVLLVGGAAWFAIPATVAGTAATAAAGTANAAAAAGGAAAAGSALVSSAATGGALVTNAVGGAAAIKAAATTAATGMAALGARTSAGFATRALLTAGITGATAMSLKAWLELAETREGQCCVAGKVVARLTPVLPSHNHRQAH